MDVAVIGLAYAADEGPRDLLCLSAAAHVNAQTERETGRATQAPSTVRLMTDVTYRRRENVHPPINIFKSIIAINTSKWWK